VGTTSPIREETMGSSMTGTEAMDIIDSISYKPNFELRARMDNLNLDMLLDISYSTQDSTHAVYKEARIASSNILDIGRLEHPEEVVDWVKDMITIAEHHERDEWFKYKGELVNDPHAK